MRKRHLFHIFSFAIALTLLFFSDVSKSSAFLGGDSLQQTTYEKLNLLILVKASQSSNHKLSDLSYSKTRLEIVQDSIASVLDQYPFPPNVNLGIMAYGHIIDRTEFSTTCSSDNVELVLPFQPALPNINLNKFLVLTGLGEVPAAVALEEAGKVFTETSPNVLNVILLIADGSDTCGQDPVVKARELADSKDIIIHAIGFMTGDTARDELEKIALQSSGKFEQIDQYIDDNEVAQAELTGAISTVFDELFTQISIPTQTNTPTLTEVASLTPASTDTPIPAFTSTEISPQPTLGIISPVPISTEEPPSSLVGSFGIILVAAIFVLGASAFGLWFWKSRTTAKFATKPSASESKITDVQKLDIFWKDLCKAFELLEAKKYSSTYIPVEQVREKLSMKYTHQEFDELLAQARRKYPNKIWMDRDAKNQPVFIKMIR